MTPYRIIIDETSNPHRHRHIHAHEHELLVVEDGDGGQLAGREELPCTSLDVFLFPAGFPHLSYCAPGQRFNCLVLPLGEGDLSPDDLRDGGMILLRRLAAAGGRDTRLPLPFKVRLQLRNVLIRAVAEAQSAAPGARWATRALAMEALVTACRGLPAASAETRHDQAGEQHHIQAVNTHLEAHFMLPVRIADLVALGPLGRSRLLAAFRATTGRSIGAALLERRLAEARARLLKESPSMLDIALACGFGSQSHFNHLFRRSLGCAPAEWARRQNRSATSRPAPRRR